MQIKDVLRAFARESPASLTEVVARVNRFACNTQRFDDSGDGMFTCLVIAFLDTATGEGEIVFAGCEPPVILRSLSDVEYLPMENACLPLGITAEASYMSVPLHLKPGETLIFMTDGITEARALKTREYPGIRFLETTGAVALAQQVRETHTLRGMGEAILEGARAFAGGALHDDACVLLARLRTA
jgi:serine phosphatase RsbU (regulator of sigma subunit)